MGSKLMASSVGANRMSARPRGDTVNADDPRGQFGSFLRHWVDTKQGGDEKPLAKELGKSDRTIRAWITGHHGPAFEDLDRIAKAMGYANWAKLAAAVVRYAE